MIPVHAIVTISVPSASVPQETITAGMGASMVEGGILIFDIVKPSFLKIMKMALDIMNNDVFCKLTKLTKFYC